MKILVAIANYGTANDQYLFRVIDEYRKMKHDVDIVVTTNVQKDLGSGVELVVGLPERNPRSLPFAHKTIFAQRADHYDLFIYTEDDNLATKHNVEAFLRVTDVLPSNEIAGFLRTEKDASGSLYFSEPHYHYHWDPLSVRSQQGYTFAFFTNEHAGFYILTRDQLKRAIQSGGYLVPFHHHKYPPLETAATDPYTQCGFRKMMCISQIEDFLFPHLSNRYAGRGAQPAEIFYSQLKALNKVAGNGKPKKTLFPVETRIFHTHWSKDYYEPVQSKLTELVPEGTRTALSVGCGWGETERALIDRGIKVKAIPIDSVIAVNAESRGVEIVYTDAAHAHQALANERFDCILFSNLLHLVENPEEFVTQFIDLLSPSGTVVVSAPNITMMRLLARRYRFGKTAIPRGYEQSGMHATTAPRVRNWLRKAGLRPIRTLYDITEQGKMKADELSLGLVQPLLGSNVYVAATRPAEARKS